MKLYDYTQAPNPRRARIFMAEKGVLDDVEVVQIDLGKGEQFGDEYKAKNPFRRLPMLELDDGTCIAESVAICRYFEETVPEPPLMGAGDARDRALVEMWQRRMEFNLFLQVGMAFRNLSGFFAQYEDTNEAWGETCKENASKMFHILNKHFADNEYVCGDAFTIADITALCAVDFARTVKLRIGEDQANLQRWYDSVSARPSAKA